MIDEKLIDLRRTFKLPKALGRILALLLDERYVSTAMIEVEHKVVTDAKVAISRLRKVLAEHNVTIHSMRDMGYWLDDEAKKYVLSAINGAPVVQPEPAAEAVTQEGNTEA